MLGERVASESDPVSTEAAVKSGEGLRLMGVSIKSDDGRIVMRDVSYYAQAPIEAVLLGIKFDGFSARLVLSAQAMAAATLALGLAAERRWGLRFALACLLEVVISNFIFMLTYMDDLREGRSVRLAGWFGIAAVLILLYLWVRGRDLLQEENPPS